MIMKPEKIACMNVFGEHLCTWSGRRAQDQTLRWRVFALSSYVDASTSHAILSFGVLFTDILCEKAECNDALSAGCPWCMGSDQ
jgi:hypothetical protein